MEPRPSSQQDDANGVVSSVMVRLEPAQYMQVLLTAHSAEDAFEHLPEDVGDEE